MGTQREERVLLAQERSLFTGWGRIQTGSKGWMILDTTKKGQDLREIAVAWCNLDGFCCKVFDIR